MITLMRTYAALPLLFAAGCAAHGAMPACPPGYRALVLAEAFFGRAIAGRAEVSDAEWAVFAAEELTARFPDGLSITDIAGQWRGRDGRIVREATKRVGIVLTDPDSQRLRLLEAAEAYRARFAQDSVLLTEAPVCARF
jgi:hypothetical protein